MRLWLDKKNAEAGIQNLEAYELFIVEQSGTRRPVEAVANLKEKTMAKAKKGKGKVKKTKPMY